MSSTESSDADAAQTAVTVPPAGPVAQGGERLRVFSRPGFSLTVRSRAGRTAGLPTALFLHGLGGSSQNWSVLMAKVADVVQGEALDLPGFGYSPPPDDGDYSISGHARTVVRYLEESGRGPVHLVGNSMGGTVAVRIAARRPDLVRTLTLISPALPEIPPQRTAWPTALASVPGLPRLYQRVTRDWPIERRTRALLALCYGDPGAVGRREFEEDAREYARRLTLPYFWDAMARSTRGIVDAYTLGGQHAMWRQAERVLAPTLLVYGGRDKLVSFRMARRAARAFRDSRLLAIPDGGHVSMMEHPELVARAFRDLLAERADGKGTAPGTTDRS
ncbi:MULTISPECIES: alpha/beta fold hydrolase [Streptomycetaceae]|uniref:Hydrolase n=1 Tax=Streptantibioticus cattleyicolor (strain ATCC 35852 / DSM 46488 / JCM 4925 / NBRC 14057 / NRRL 8057) TaxID=1003195 RepID=F8K4M8_STREN|nr:MULTISPECIES: alpha/beta hydrolase [Streptomycetaceae]AEW96384.1 hydrolase [Streptantibioticus cattleyicolor NRRL 8057 = DSM 46488]MYS60897.1 alpha/beta fold hydrolase [Streptomyces sp. SID5468]CCB76723.1 putative hydrolase [Streptantibioticus cattleyicolor NRRL 8057 = DSM 46488]